MAQQTINTGTLPNDGTGDSLLAAWTKANANFTELYSAPILSGILSAGGFNATGSSLPANGMYLSAGNTIAFATNTTLRLSIDGSGNGILTGNLRATSFIPTSSSVPSTGMYFPGGNTLGFSCGTALRYSIDANGVHIVVAPTAGIAMTINGVNGTHSTRIADSAATLFDAGFLGAASATAGTAVIADRGKTIVITANLTIPNAVFAAGDQVRVYNNTAGALTLNAGITTMRLDGTAGTGARTLAQRGLAFIYFVSGTECVVSGAAVT